MRRPTCLTVSRIFTRTMLFLLVPVSAWALDPEKSIAQFSTRNWTRSSGLPADRITAIAQDSHGYLWLGAQNGLVRYDGHAFSTVSIDLPSARGTSVEHIKIGSDGMLWFSVMQGGFGGFDGRKFVELATADWAMGYDASCLTVARDGSLWTGTVGGWGRWNPGHPEQTIPITGPQSVTGIWEEASGRIWFGSVMAGLSYWEKGVVSLFEDRDLLKTNIHAVVRDLADDLWVGTNRGLFRYDAAGRRKAVYFPETKSTALLVDRHGVLWIGTGGEGLRRYRDGKFSQLTKLDGLGSDVVTALCEDAEGSLWVGTAEGLSQISDVKFPIFSSSEGLPSGGIISIAASPAGGLWVGSETGAAFLGSDGAVKRVPPSLQENAFTRRIFQAKNGDLYIGDGTRSLWLIREEKIAGKFLQEGWPEAFLDDGHGLLVGIGPALYRIENDHIEPYAFDGTPPAFNWINCLVRGSKGEIWVGTNAGLFRIEGGAVQQWSKANGLLSDRVHCIVSEADGRIWLGMETGLVTMKDGKFSLLGIREGLSDPLVYGIVPDELGSFWLWSGMGPLRVKRSNLSAFLDGSVKRIECETFQGQESIKVTARAEQGYGGARTSDGRIWFATPRGVAMIDPKGYVTNQRPPPVRIEKIRMKDGEVRDASAVKMKQGERNLEFSYAALTYIAEEKVKVRYQLEGFDPDWIDGSNRRTASYNNLPFGEYVFRVTATNADGVDSREPATVKITIPPPFYARGWFFLLVAVGVIFLVYFGYQTKVRHMSRLQQKLQRENEALEARVRQRTDELGKSVSLLQATLDSTEDGILAVSSSGAIVGHNVQLEQMWRLSPNALHASNAKSLYELFAQQAKDPAVFLARLEAICIGSESDACELIELRDGRVFERYCRVQMANNRPVGIVMNYRDITQRRQAESRLEEAHRQLLLTSRQAGMAEVATSVLHNVGNVLNSVNVSATVVADQVRNSKVMFVARVADLLQTNAANLAEYLSTDPKGRKIAPYLSTLSASLVEEQTTMAAELQDLVKNIEHIKEVVSRQQSLAKISGVKEMVSLQDLMEDSLRMTSTALSRHGVEVVRDYEMCGPVAVDRHKVMQILINLVSNAKQACNEGTASGKKIIVKVVSGRGHIQVHVLDNGVGIPTENLTRIFAHGFTTKKEGHGFGLHHAALSAKEMGGSLRAESGGVGQGATFILELPIIPPA